jgi:hypothetical protein
MSDEKEPKLFPPLGDWFVVAMFLLGVYTLCWIVGRVLENEAVIAALTTAWDVTRAMAGLTLVGSWLYVSPFISLSISGTS